MTTFTTSDQDFTGRFEELLGRGKMDIAHVSSIVSGIIEEIKADRNSALMRHIAKFDHWEPKADSDLKIDTASMKAAYEALEPKLKEALHLAYDRIREYHEKQMPRSWFDTERNGTILGQKVTP